MPGNPLNERSEFPRRYSPEVLFAIPRDISRSSVGIDERFNIKGVDHWRAYEISWIDDSGKTEVRVGEIFFDLTSKNIIESKSLKLYLNSFNEEVFISEEDIKEKIIDDLSRVSESEVSVLLHKLNCGDSLEIMRRTGRSIDNEKISNVSSQPNILALDASDITVTDERLYSDLFRSICPITGQPDWASFQIEYSGGKISECGLLSYLCSFRAHGAYHEECAERIFYDIYVRCRPTELSISLNFLRRGGIDINVYRSTKKLNSNALMTRLIRQ
tara:strand:+ start:300 stop:1118 length:819 start_codon:yes stop_codon:yes gene_type:complete